MYKWNKLGRVFNPQDHATNSWMSEFAQAPSVIKYEDFIRVYISSRPLMDENGQYKSYTGFIELNRKDLFDITEISSQPILELGKLGTFDEFGIYPTSVIKEKDRYLAYYAGWTRCDSVPFNVAIGMAESEDGKKFRKFGDGPIVSYSIDEPFNISGPKIRKFNNQYYLFYIAGKKWIANDPVAEPVYRIRLATSDDGVNWNKLNKDLIDVKLEADECQASPDVIFANGKYHMFYCYRYSLGYRGKEKGYRIGYASSTDLINWERDDDKVGITVSEEGWDSEMVSYPHVFELDGSIYMFYLGNHVGRFGFGLAKLEGQL